jgi:acetyl esterase/lipase
MLSAAAQVPSTENLAAVDKNLGITTLPLWSGAAGDEGGKNSETSFLTLFAPQSGRGNGTAVIVAPGGAYKGLASNLEGRQVADWFTARGVTAFVLKYRLGEGNPYPAPLLDAQRAVRLVRSVCNTYHLSPDRIGIMGFSAGGHLAAMEATSFDDGKQESSDPVERLSNRPDFLILGYPWLNAMQPNSKHLITYCSVLSGMPASECAAWEEKYTPALHVSAKTPSTFIYHTTDDGLVPVQTSVEFYSALLNAGVPAEMHLFRHGAHGSGLGTGDEALDLWPVLLEAWMRGQGWLTPDRAGDPKRAASR